jgi:hypothetical protein
MLPLISRFGFSTALPDSTDGCGAEIEADFVSGLFCPALARSGLTCADF